MGIKNSIRNELRKNYVLHIERPEGDLNKFLFELVM